MFGKNKKKEVVAGVSRKDLEKSLEIFDIMKSSIYALDMTVKGYQGRELTKDDIQACIAGVVGAVLALDKSVDHDELAKISKAAEDTLALQYLGEIPSLFKKGASGKTVGSEIKIKGNLSGEELNSALKGMKEALKEKMGVSFEEDTEDEKPKRKKGAGRPKGSKNKKK